jgi:transcriptional regulator with XRE-family HTH domain
LGARVGLEQSHISAIEKGKRLPSLRKLLLLAEALDAPVSLLPEIGVGGEGDSDA